MNIGLNAHLLSSQPGYRSAGIHGYIYNTLSHLVSVAPADWRFQAWVSKGNPHHFPGILMQPAFLNTQHPLTRIGWEQVVQPFHLRHTDLYHAMAFVAPVVPTKPPRVVTIYDLSFIHYPAVLSGARRAYLQAFTAYTCRQAQRIIAISESTAQDVAQTFRIAPEKIHVAPAGTDLDVFRPLPPEEVALFKAARGLPQDFWLFVGTLEPRKNLPVLLQAYARLPRDSRPLLVLGGGKGWDYRAIFDTIQQLDLVNEVRLPGFLSAEELPLWYNSASVFVYPSVYEGFGLPVLEAMACGTPVIASDTSAFPEVVGKSDGLLVNAHLVDAWQQALTQALDDAGWRSRAGASGRVAAQAYSWQNTARATVAAYRQAVEG